MRRFNEVKVFAVCCSIADQVDNMLREAGSTLLLCAIGQYTDMTVLTVCHSVTETVVNVGIKRNTAACARCADSLTA